MIKLWQRTLEQKVRKQNMTLWTILLLLDYLIYNNMHNQICHLLKRKQFVNGKTHFAVGQEQPEIPARLTWMDGLKGVDSVEEAEKTNLD